MKLYTLKRDLFDAEKKITAEIEKALGNDWLVCIHQFDYGHSYKISVWKREFPELIKKDQEVESLQFTIEQMAINLDQENSSVDFYSQREKDAVSKIINLWTAVDIDTLD